MKKIMEVITKNEKDRNEKKIMILHLVNIAGVAGLLAKLHHRKFSEHYKGYKAKVIARKNQDYYGFNEVYGKYGTYIGGRRALWFYIYVALFLFFKRPKIIQIHAAIKVLKLINKFKGFIFYNPYIIYHSHGGDTRGLGIEEWLLKNCNDVIVSTEDLRTHTKFMHINSPIDSDLFFPDWNLEKTGKALYINNFLQYEPKGLLEEAEKFCELHELELTVLDRMSSIKKKITTLEEYMKVDKKQGDFIPYKEIGAYYRKFEYFLDFKGLTKIETKKPVFSKAAIEASYCGCIVAQEDGKIHFPHNVKEWFFDGYIGFDVYYSNLWRKVTGTNKNE